jgi:hypothetical protein
MRSLPSGARTARLAGRLDGDPALHARLRALQDPIPMSHRLRPVRARGVVALAAVSLLLSFARAPFGTSADKYYGNGKFQFSLNVFNDWNPVPPEISEKYEVAKWYDPLEKGDRFPPALSILRLNVKGDPEAADLFPTTGEPAKPKAPKPRIDVERMAPKDMYELATREVIGFDAKKFPADKNWKPVTSRDKVAGKFWAFEIPFGGPPGSGNGLLFLLFAYEKDGVSYGVRLLGSARRRDTFEPIMKGMARSFLYFDAKAKETTPLTALNGINLSPARRKQIEGGLVKGWDVLVSPKKNYVVVYNTKGGRNKELAHILAERIEKIREQVYEKQFPPAHPVTAVSVMRVCGDATEYHAYGGPGGTAGYWNDHSEELVFYDASPSRRVDDNTLSVLYHEAFHQYIYYSVGNVAPHSWFNEGHGDYYAGAKFGTTRFVIGPFAWRVGVIKNAINEGPRPFTVAKDDKGEEHKKWGSKGYTPLKDLVGFSQREYYSYPSVCYAEGWSLIYFLREEVPKKKEWNAKWGKILPTYFDVLKREVAKREAEKAARLAKDPPAEPSTPGPVPAPTDPPADPNADPDKKPDSPANPPDDPGTKPADPGTRPTDPADPAKPPEGPDAPKDPTAPDGPAPTPKDPDGKDPKDPGGAGGDDPPADPGFQPEHEGESSQSALELALKEAFAGVDFDELEAAWRETIRHVK